MRAETKRVKNQCLMWSGTIEAGAHGHDCARCRNSETAGTWYIGAILKSRGLEGVGAMLRESFSASGSIRLNRMSCIT